MEDLFEMMKEVDRCYVQLQVAVQSLMNEIEKTPKQLRTSPVQAAARAMIYLLRAE